MSDVRVFSAIERFLIGNADAVVTVNPLLAEVMREIYDLRLVRSVPKAEPWMEGRSRGAPGSAMERLAQGRVRFLFLGRLAPERGIDELMIGSFPNKLSQYLHTGLMVIANDLPYV
jgi:hypothetical protein